MNCAEAIGRPTLPEGVSGWCGGVALHPTHLAPAVCQGELVPQRVGTARVSPPRVAAMVVVCVIALVAIVRGPAGHQPYVFEDHRVNAETVNRMKHGEGFYRAFDGA